jgi:hypothetical protein
VAVWGIYVGDCESVQVSSNTLSDIGVNDNGDTGGIKISSGVLRAEIANNVMSDFAGTYGIAVNNATAKVRISGNVMSNLGSTSYFISGNSTYATVSDNQLVGPGKRGIVWTGQYSKLANNNLVSGASYSFSEYGIYAGAANIDIEGNTLNGLVWQSDTITGIYNYSGSSRIMNNTLIGTQLSVGIDLTGSAFNVANNTIINTTNNATDFIRFSGGTSDSLIASNVFQGDGNYVFNSDTTNVILSGVSFTNNVASAASVSKVFNLNDADDDKTIGCLILGNKLPYGDNTNTIGSTPSALLINTNTIGVNPGLLAGRTIPAAAFRSGWVSTVPDWAMDAGSNYWTASTAAVAKYLYIPITGLVDGAQLTSIHLYGLRGDGTWTATLYRCSISAVYTSIGSTSGTTFPSAVTITSGNSPTDTTREIMNNEQNSYFVVLSTNGTGSNVVYSARANFIY